MSENDKRSSLFVTEIINTSLFDQAGWLGVAFLTADDKPPLLGLYFENQAAGRAIFIEWIEKLGVKDSADALRISLVEGKVPKTSPGYFVLLSLNWDAAKRRANALGVKADLIITTSRIHRMESEIRSPHVKRFKDSYAQFGVYGLLLMTGIHPHLQPDFNTLIQKQKIYFKDYEKLNANDPESILLKWDGDKLA